MLSPLLLLRTLWAVLLSTAALFRRPLAEGLGLNAQSRTAHPVVRFAPWLPWVVGVVLASDLGLGTMVGADFDGLVLGRALCWLGVVAGAVLRRGALFDRCAVGVVATFALSLGFGGSIAPIAIEMALACLSLPALCLFCGPLGVVELAALLVVLGEGLRARAGLSAVETLALQSLLAAVTFGQLRVRRAEAVAIDQYHTMFTHLTDGVAIYDFANQRAVRVSPSFVKMFGFGSEEEALAATLANMVHPDDQVTTRAAISSTTIAHNRARNRCADGTWLWCEVHGHVLPDTGYHLLYIRDASAERDLKRSSVFLDALFAQIEGEAVVAYDAINHRMVRTSRSFGALLRLDDPMAITLHSVVHEDDRSKCRAAVGATTIERVRFRALCGDGATFSCEVHGVVLPDTGYHLVFFRDVTAEKKAEDAVRLFHALEHPVYEYDWARHKMVRCNEAFASFLGLSMEEALASTFSSLCHPEDQAKAQAHIRPAEIRRFRCRVVRKGGGVAWVEIHGIVHPDGNMLVQWRDAQADIELERKTRDLETILSATHDLVFVWDPQHNTYDFVNPAVERLLGWTPDEAKVEWRERRMVHPDDKPTLQRHMADRQWEHGETCRLRFVRADGGHVALRASTVVLEDGRHQVMAHDVEAEEALEAKTAEMEGTLRMLDEIGVGIICTSSLAEGLVVTFVSEAWERITGWPRAEAVGRRNGSKFLQGPDTEEDVLAEVRAGIASGNPVSVVLTNYRKDGTPFKCQMTAVRLNNGEYGGTVRDVTAQCERDAEHARAVAAEHARVEAIGLELRHLIEYANAPIFGVDTEGNVNEWNSAMARISGFSKEDAIRKNFFSTFIDSKMQNTVKKVVSGAFQGRPTKSHTVEIRTKNGDVRNFLMSTSMRYNFTSAHSAHIAEAVNNLGRLRMLTERTLSKVTTPKSYLEYVRTLQNAEVERIASVFALEPSRERATQVIAAVDYAIQQIIWLSTNIVDPASKPAIVGAICVAQDLTDYEREKAALVAATARADAERGLNDFLAHEVRNPLSVAVGMLRFVAEALGEGHDAVHRDLSALDISLVYIDELLTNMLDLNKFVEGKIPLRPAPCSLRDAVLRPVVAMLGASQRSLHLSVEYDDPLWVSADALRLKQVFVNLVKNARAELCNAAIKFVPRGYVRLGAARTSPERVTLWVADSGPGIPPDKVEGLFQKYTQLNAHDQGTGIGLALCRSVVGAAGGTIGVDQAYRADGSYGVGAKFVVELPLAEIDPPEAEAEADEGPAFVRGRYAVLIVDDNAALRELWRRALESISTGWRIDEAEHGEAALERVGAATYDLITMDHFMAPSGGARTGAETIAALRERGVEALIIGASGNDLKTEHLDAGADLFWLKPFPPPAAIARALNARLPLPRALRVLLADDDPGIRMVTTRKLETSLPECVVTTVESGQAAADAIESDAVFDLVVLDQNMGAVKGTEVARRARAAGSAAVVVGFSADPMEDAHRAAGCDLSWDKMKMPLGEALRVEVRAALRRAVPVPVGGAAAADATDEGASAEAPAAEAYTEGAAAEEPPAEEPAADADAEAPAAEAPAAEGAAAEEPAAEAVDDAPAAPRPYGLQCMHDELGAETYVAVAGIFVKHMRADAESLRARVEEGAWSGASRITHKLRGSLGQCKLDAVVAAVEELNAALRRADAQPEAAAEARARCPAVVARLLEIVDYLADEVGA